MIKKIFALAFSAVLLVACGAKTEIETPVEVLENYGPFDVKVEEAITAKEMVAMFKNSDESQTYTFKGELTGVCAKAGCWISVADGTGGDFMIRFDDYFTIPTDTE